MKERHESKSNHDKTGFSKPPIEFISEEAREAYQQRSQRIQDASELKVPDRVPVIESYQYFPARYAGITVKECINDFDAYQKAYLKTLADFPTDTADAGIGLAWAKPLAALDSKRIRVAGAGVDENSSHQFVEGEHMKADEYDHFLDDPSDFLLRIFLSRTLGKLEPMQ